MKNFKRTLMILPLAAIFFIVASCSNDDDDDIVMLPETITELAAATPDLSLLVDALTRANLTETLNQPGSYTVFAPTNAAFSAFLSQNNIPSLGDVSVPP